MPHALPAPPGDKTADEEPSQIPAPKCPVRKIDTMEIIERISAVMVATFKTSRPTHSLQSDAPKQSKLTGNRETADNDRPDNLCLMFAIIVANVIPARNSETMARVNGSNSGEVKESDGDVVCAKSNVSCSLSRTF